ncbi:MAG: flavodoxin family protein [Bacillota bacterium]|nr:flavodoxin family protein [Bacillota bacterium]
MKALLISDKDYQTETYQQIKNLVSDFLKEKGFEIDVIDIGRDDLAFCMGCFGCWIKTPGECVIQDGMKKINNSFVNSDAVIYLSPVIFGQFSANIKNAVDRWIPNILPFFITRPDGSTMHPSRYENYPAQIIIGYGDELSPEDSQLFTDITKKHRRNVEVIIYKDDQDLTVALNKIQLGRVDSKL